MSARIFRELFSNVMDPDREVTADEVRAAVNTAKTLAERKGIERESLHHDFKSARVLETDANRTKLRADVAAFANSDGGLLVIGVEDDSLEIKPFIIGNGAHPLDRLAQSLEPVRVQLSPPPVLKSVSFERGDVVVLIAIPRSARLVSVMSGSTPTYPLRFASGTIPNPPEYLLTDLVLGRREQPMLEIAEPKVGQVDVSHARSSVGLTFCVENVGFAWAEALSVGVVMRVAKPSDGRPLGRVLEEFVSDCHDPQLVPDDTSIQHSILNAPHGKAVFELRPFERSPWLTLSLSVRGAPAADILFGLYITPRGSRPSWFQVRVRLRGPHSHRPELLVEPSARVLVGWMP